MYQYEVWTDSNKTLASTYRAVRSQSQRTPSRVTVILDAQGNHVLEYNPVSGVGDHPGEVLEDCRALFGQ